MDNIICKNCILTPNEDPNIKFNDKGVCNHCQEFYWKEKQRRLDKPNWPWIVYEIKKAGKGKDAEVIIGLSGGVDSSMTLYYLIQQGLKVTAFSVDNGHNNPDADENILRMVEHYKVPFYRYVIDLDKFKQLQFSLLKSGIKNLESATDHILQAVTYEMASKYKIKYIASGGNLATEAILPEHFGHNARDLTFLKAIYKKFTGKKLTGLPVISLWKYLWFRFFKGIKIIQVLNYYEYDRKKAIKLLSDEFGYKDYGSKHNESFFTQWFQEYYLPTKFGLDKRIPHLSNEINSAQITRQQALEEMKKPLNGEKLNDLICGKFGLTSEGLSNILKSAPKDLKDYKNSEYWWKLFSKIYEIYKRAKGINKNRI